MSVGGQPTGDRCGRCRRNRAYKLKLMGLTPERFAQMLETQGYACAMP